MNCFHQDCLRNARYIPVLRLFTLGITHRNREMRQIMAGYACCDRHKGLVEKSLLSDPWFSGYAQMVEDKHGFKASRALSRVLFMDAPNIAEAS